MASGPKIFEMIVCLQRQNDTLTKVRDLLLTRPMNGEVTV